MAKTLHRSILAILLVITAGIAVAGGTAVGADLTIGDQTPQRRRRPRQPGPGQPGRTTGFRPTPVSVPIVGHWRTGGERGGRVTDLVAHPNQANVVFAGAATGGVWKSTDGGLSWQSLGWT
jgi:hypothetical protein